MSCARWRHALLEVMSKQLDQPLNIEFGSRSAPVWAMGGKPDDCTIKQMPSAVLRLADAIKIGVAPRHERGALKGQPGVRVLDPAACEAFVRTRLEKEKHHPIAAGLVRKR